MNVSKNVELNCKSDYPIGITLGDTTYFRSVDFVKSLIEELKEAIVLYNDWLDE